ncbi:MAG: hypothetical protein RIQ81_1634 [Pseudomonadota bacterium]|jgi:hypothetical protein
MNPFPRVKALASAVCLTAAYSGVVTDAWANNNLPGLLEKRIEEFRTSLADKGYETVRGGFHLFNIEDCKYAIKTIGNCMGNNPTAPYVIPTLPRWPDEFIDPSMEGLIGPTELNTGWTWRMDPQEAIVILGQLPPKARYFGLQSYIFTRDVEPNPSDLIFQTLDDAFMKSILFMSAPNPSRRLVFASVGDSINNMVIADKSGEAFDQDRYFVVASDANMASDLSDALMAAGVPDRRDIFTEPLSPSLARLGLGNKADDFMILLRYAMPEDETAGEAWRKNIPLAILRIRSKNPAHLTQPFPLPERGQRIGRSELDLAGSVDAVVSAVKQKWNQPDASESQFFSLLEKVDLLGEHCLKRPMNCLGDTADADYQISQTVQIDSGEVIAAVGTLGTATGNATYTSLSVNRIPELVGASNLSDLDLSGTAAEYISDANASKLYVRYFARNCEGISNCMVVKEGMVPLGGQMKLIQRNYLVPGSARGPDPKQLVNPRLIVLKR